MIRVRQVKVNIFNSNIEEIKKQTSKKLRIKENDINNIKIIKESIDARDKENIYYIYEVEIDALNEDEILKNNKSGDIYIPKIKEYKSPKIGKEKLKEKIVIVGSGPAGLFCAYMLSLNGYRVIVLERGDKVEERSKKVEKFWNTGKLDKNSNVQFGEGGAGTFSDGKLNTLVKDKNGIMKKVFEIFIENGAPSEILYKNKPHIGTDLLKNVIINMRNKIISMGGEFRYNSCLTDININDNKVESIIINNKEEILCNILVLAIGNSARDTFYMLYDKGINMTSKPFAVGIRIQHPQEMINSVQYGKVNSKYLGIADYKLTYTSKSNRGVYSFCMCPGGYVVNASSEEEHLVINGMSNHKRDSKNANSAIVVQVTEKDFGNDVFDGIRFQRMLEENAYKAGNGDIPIQLFKDFKKQIVSTNFEDVKPVFKGNYTFSDLNNIFPKFISENLKEAIDYFGEKIKGFNMDGAILSAVETRTSAPIRIFRNENLESNIGGIYPSGEGAGYSGGITTSAMDGIKVSEVIIKRFDNNI